MIRLGRIVAGSNPARLTNLMVSRTTYLGSEKCKKCVQFYYEGIMEQCELKWLTFSELQHIDCGNKTYRVTAWPLPDNKGVPPKQEH